MHRLIAIALTIAASGCTFASPNAGAQSASKQTTFKKLAPAKGPLLELQTEKVIVFKDGYCLVLKRGQAITNEDGEIHMTDVPDAAVLGSFWATPANDEMISMVAGWKETTSETSQQIAAAHTMEVLAANEGKSCSLKLPNGESLRGRIHKVLTKSTSTAISPSHRGSIDAAIFNAVHSPTSTAGTVSTSTTTVSNLSGSQFILRTNDGDTLLNASDVKQLTIQDMTFTIDKQITTKKREKRLTFRFAKPNTKQQMLIAYFRPGVRWIPTYRIDLADKENMMAEVSLQAEILNESEDLLDTPMDIVVGVPNFRFRNVTSPFTLESVLRNSLQQAAPQIMGNFRNDMSNAMYSQRSSEFRRNGANASAVGQGGAVNLPNELTAAGSQDLFVYSLPNIDLRRGERAAVPIFTTKVPYKNVHTWDIQVKKFDIATAPSGSGLDSPLKLSQNTVWRQIELTNNTKIPWTTGAAMIMDGHQPLAQELLTYTSPTDACRVPVTVAIDVRGAISEEEIGREMSVMKWRGYNYAKLTQKTDLSVCNHKPEEITLEITYQFGGKADSATADGKITLAPYRQEDWERYRGDPAMNNSSTVRWKVKLKPGEVFNPTVKYHYFAQH